MSCVALGCDNFLAAWPILLEVFRIGKELGYRVGQGFAGQVRFFQQDCGAFSLQGLRVDFLVVVAGPGEGMKIDGLPAAATSPTVLAPERHTSRSARAKIVACR